MISRPVAQAAATTAISIDMKKVLVGLSGGIDSTYVCKYLSEKGYQVVGMFLKFHKYSDSKDAQAVAQKLGISFFTADYTELFDRVVKKNFVDEYSDGRTPNPCVICNREVKFHALLEQADKHGCELVATGHYANIVNDNGEYLIKCGADMTKDQSYVLWNLKREYLPRLIMPMGTLEKQLVKKELFEGGILPDSTQESQEICFIPDKDYISYIQNIKGEFPQGDFIDKDGKIIGRHNGIIRYTIGQRKRLGAFGKPAFVSSINADTNTITIGFGDEIMNKTIWVDNLNFVSCQAFEGEGEFMVKPRYKAPPTKAYVKIENGIAKVEFETPVRAAAPGQSAVFYKDQTLMFGGLITK